MVRLSFAVACCALVVGTAAQAQVTVADSAASTVFNDQTYLGEGHQTSFGQNTSYSSLVTDNGKSVSFTSGNTVLGQFAGSTSFSDVTFRVTNNSDLAQVAQLSSEITAASMGFYVADGRGGAQGCGSNPAACSQVGSLAAQGLGPALHDTFNSFSVGGNGTDGTLARASFDFNVRSGDEQLLHLGGTMYLNSDGVFVDEGLQSAFGFLNATNESLGNANSGDVTSWGAKDIGPFALGLLEGGAFADVTYNITVSSQVNVGCLNDGACLVAFSAFGDPVGRGGGVSSVDSASFRAFAQSFGLGPQFITGLDFQDTPLTATATFGSVPEPATWTMMIAGFGLLGAALRRRRVLAYT